MSFEDAAADAPIIHCGGGSAGSSGVRLQGGVAGAITRAGDHGQKEVAGSNTFGGDKGADAMGAVGVGGSCVGDSGAAAASTSLGCVATSCAICASLSASASANAASHISAELPKSSAARTASFSLMALLRRRAKQLCPCRRFASEAPKRRSSWRRARRLSPSGAAAGAEHGAWRRSAPQLVEPSCYK